MNYYLLIIKDSQFFTCCDGTSSLDIVLSKIKASITNGYIQLIDYSYIFKSNQNINYWENVILTIIDKCRHTFFITKIDPNINFGYVSSEIWNWFTQDKKEKEQTLCTNHFEIESCNKMNEIGNDKVCMTLTLKDLSQLVIIQDKFDTFKIEVYKDGKEIKLDISDKSDIENFKTVISKMNEILNFQKNQEETKVT